MLEQKKKTLKRLKRCEKLGLRQFNGTHRLSKIKNGTARRDCRKKDLKKTRIGRYWDKKGGGQPTATRANQDLEAGTKTGTVKMFSQEE